MEDPGRCWAEIDLDALRHNAGVVRERVGNACRIMAIVKAGAYGHGMLETARALAGITQVFGVACVSEARVLKAALPEAQIHLLGPALPHEREEVVREGFVPPVSSFEEAAAYSALGSEAARGKAVRVHLAVDTGMGRIGVWEAEALEAAGRMLRLPGLKIAGIASHLPVADEDEAFTGAQLRRFGTLVRALRELGLDAPLVHSLNSAGVIRFSSEAHDMVRVGLMLYGSSPIPDFQRRLRPVMALKTRVSLVREVGAGRGISYGRTFISERPMRVATLAAGYADGYQRRLSNEGAAVLIQGRRCHLLGRVTMDQIMVDITALGGVAPGDEAVLMGRQGSEEIFACELAEKAGTIAWEIFTGVGVRVARTYLHGNPVPGKA